VSIQHILVFDNLPCLFQAGPGGTSAAAAAGTGTGTGGDRAAGGQNPRDTQRTTEPADAARRRLGGGDRTGSSGLDAPKHKSPGHDEATIKDTVSYES
jgi:hypothetical protein